MATKKTKAAAGEERDYVVTGWVSLPVSKTIRARSAAEAREKADALAVPRLCHQCEGAGDDDAGSWVIGEAGDCPEDVTVEGDE